MPNLSRFLLVFLIWIENDNPQLDGKLTYIKVTYKLARFNRLESHITKLKVHEANRNSHNYYVQGASLKFSLIDDHLEQCCCKKVPTEFEE